MAVDAIAQKVQEMKSEGKELHLCIIHDEMSMKNQVSWNEGNASFKGLATKTNQNENNEKDQRSVAKDSLTYMAVGPDFRIAFAYFLIDGLQSIDRAALSKEVKTTGSFIISLIGDGLRANIASYEILGADFRAYKPYFASPSHPDRNIYIIFDPPHMLKLIRKDFSNHKLYFKNDPLRWDLLEKLAAKNGRKV